MKIEDYAEKISKDVDNGDLEATYEMGVCLFVGLGFDSFEEAEEAAEVMVDVICEAAEEGHTGAEAFAVLLEEGAEREEIAGALMDTYIKLADKNDIEEAQCALGDIYADDDYDCYDLAEAFYWYERSAKNGFAEAQNNLGMCYYLGEGTAVDYGSAFYWIEKSALQGFPEGQFWLAMCYERGDGVSRNEKTAFKWYEKSAKQNNRQAQRKLAECYENGIGVKKDKAKADRWYKTANNS